MRNNPINYNDPSGHVICNDEGVCFTPPPNTGIIQGDSGSTSSGGGGNSGSSGGQGDEYAIDFGVEITDDSLSINFSVNNQTCSSTCQLLANGLGLGAVVADIFALGANAALMVAVYVGCAVNPLSCPGIVVGWKAASLLTNTVATIGTVGWAAQGLLTGESNVSAAVTYSTNSLFILDSIEIHGTASQDTIASATLDIMGWASPEPISAMGVSLAGVVYDVGRNPAPMFFPYEPIIPSALNMPYNLSINYP